MSTTIKSTALDFDAIKNNLKIFLANKSEFADYNFEASGLSNILDVLAYNTHYNALIANFALNESFLGTAQLRSSLVSLSEGIGYIPDSKTSAQGTINMSINLSSVTPRPSQIQIPSGFKFNSTVDEETYVFQTTETLTATDNGEGSFVFKTSSGSSDIVIREGTSRTKTFLATKSVDNPIYIISDKNLDISTAIVRVFESSTSTISTTYTDLQNANTISSASTLYILKETPNGLFELSFGNGTTLGVAPDEGNKITVEYLATNGSDANTAKVFEPQSQVTVNSVGYSVTVSTVANAVGGSDKESLESIRKNAPFQYASQNRMVTAVDYSSLILRNFSTLIKDIQSFGGEDALEPEFGTIFMSILFNDDVTATTVQTTKDSIQDLAKQLSVASFSLKFDDPVKTFIELDVFFQFNQRLTTLSKNTIQNSANNAIIDYFSTNTGKFNQSFRRSNLLTLIDNVSPAVLSSRMNVKMQRRFTPTLTSVQGFTIRYAAEIASPDDVNQIITSNSFRFRNKDCIIQNKLNSNKLQVFNTEDKEIVIDNVGDYSGDTVNIVGLQVDSFVGSDSFIKLSATPANQSVITPLRTDIVEIDTTKLVSTTVDVESGVTN
jgi:hypothetical protein